MTAADKIEAARALIEPLRATVLWQNANPNVMKAADLLAALADLADAQAQEIARLRALVQPSEDPNESGDWWTADEYDLGRSVVDDSIDNLRAAAALGDTP